MDSNLKGLTERVEKSEKALEHKAGVGLAEEYSNQLKREMTAIRKSIDDLTEATIKAVTTGSVEGLKVLKAKRY